MGPRRGDETETAMETNSPCVVVSQPPPPPPAAAAAARQNCAARPHVCPGTTCRVCWGRSGERQDCCCCCYCCSVRLLELDDLTFASLVAGFPPFFGYNSTPNLDVRDVTSIVGQKWAVQPRRDANDCFTATFLSELEGNVPALLSVIDNVKINNKKHDVLNVACNPS